jgi:hypothetical protein
MIIYRSLQSVTHYKTNNSKHSNNICRKRKLTQTMLQSKSIHREQFIANSFESYEFGRTNAIIMAPRHTGDCSPDKLNVIHLSDSKIKVYERNEMVREIVGEVSGKKYKIVSFPPDGYSTHMSCYVINYIRSSE